MNFKSKWLSNNTKVGASLDVSRQDANCINSCHAASYCYINGNIQDKMNPGYKAKMKRNFKLLSSDKFVKVIKKEILSNNIHSMRFFSNGDLVFNDLEKSKIQLLNIFNLCDELVKIPLEGKIESLNVSVACGTILYEILRQKKFNSQTFH